MSAGTKDALATIWAALGGAPDWPGRAEVVGAGQLRSAFPVTDLAAASVGAAALAAAELIDAHHGTSPGVTVDRRLASAWFARSIRPIGWDMPPAWDAVAGDYRAADGWIRLHTNAPRHRAAALAALGRAGAAGGGRAGGGGLGGRRHRDRDRGAGRRRRRDAGHGGLGGRTRRGGRSPPSRW